ncbi:MAG: hypothetical protein KDB88_10210 [Flavobacteriales bacterium]|nr:hypothetical protein [Flavobacteriales bacterium]
MADLLEILSIVAAAMVKFAVSPIWSYQLGYSLWETVAFTSLGGVVGVLFFYRISGWLMRKARIRRLRRALAAEAAGKLPARSFTRGNRLIVKVKRGHGLHGLAAITPVLISIPIGAILAAKYFYHDRRTIPVLISSVLIWSVVLSSFWTVVR